MQSPLAHLQAQPSEHCATRLCVLFLNPSPVIHGISYSPHSTDKRTEAQTEEVTRSQQPLRAGADTQMVPPLCILVGEAQG